jgi:hypothetical protein
VESVWQVMLAKDHRGDVKVADRWSEFIEIHDTNPVIYHERADKKLLLLFILLSVILKMYTT